VSKRFVNQVVMTYGLDMDPDAPFDLSAFDRHVFGMQRKDDLGRI
jgi:hypothetical protein